jgi:hypothetical protein
MFDTVPMESETHKNEADALSAELAALSRRQYEALLKSPYLRMSPEEAAEYDRRRIRIGDICELLAKYRS